MPRILLDTNVFVAAAYNRQSASREIVAAVERGELTLIVSPAIIREYEAIIPRAVRSDEGRELFRRVLELAEPVTPAENPPVTEDREDDKFLAAALVGGADAIIANDQHLLDVHPHQGIEIVRPAIFQRRLSDNAGDDEPAP